MEAIYNLSNGIKVHYLRYPNKANNICLIIGFKNGASVDKYGKEGTVHLLEHLIIKNFEKNGINELLENKGFDVNGETNISDMTLILKSNKNDVEKAITLVTKTLNNIKISKKMLFNERKIVKAEYYERLNELDANTDFILMRYGLYFYKEYNREETIKSLSKITVKDILDAKRQLFRKKNIIITLFGSIKISDFPKYNKLFEKINLNKETQYPVHVSTKGIAPVIRRKIGILNFIKDKPDINDVIFSNIFSNVMTGWFNAALDVYLRDEAKFSYGAENYIQITPKSISNVFYFQAYSKKKIQKTLLQKNKYDFLPEYKYFRYGKQRTLEDFYDSSLEKLTSLFETIHLNISSNIKYSEYLKRLKNFDYKEFKNIFESLKLYKLPGWL
ncbi:MAG: insulinase family protein [Saccharolobus sp.]